MLGELIAELKGKSVGQRVLDVAGTIEVSVSLSGNVRGTSVRGSATYVTRATNTPGVFYGKGQGILMAESEVATFTGEGFGKVGATGDTIWRAAFFYQTASTGKLAFLNNAVGVSENQVDAKGENVTDKQWEWK